MVTLKGIVWYLSICLIEQHLKDVGSGLAPEAANLSIAELGQRLNIIGGPPEALFPKNVGLMFFNDRPMTTFRQPRSMPYGFRMAPAPTGPSAWRISERDRPLAAATATAGSANSSRNWIWPRRVQRVYRRFFEPCGKTAPRNRCSRATKTARGFGTAAGA